MSPSPRPEPNAILFQLLDELENYGNLVRRLGRDRPEGQDVELFGAPGQAMDRMRSLAAALPELSAHWAMVLISHTELMHNLWRVRRGERLDVPTEVDDHLACVTSLAQQCRRLLMAGRRVLH